MREMLATGYMQNHMRMYWGKKVLEWSPTPRSRRYAQLLRINNTYFVDGRDASSFANVGWVFGLHDRPWPRARRVRQRALHERGGPEAQDGHRDVRAALAGTGRD